ncbi:hypothetical protein [Agrobacterium tumefaciens]|uniref:Transmembrane protein n=1 Tax=Agrobacterium tumefaciens TaxID=358 RepID=A0A176XJY7_AGRTU|nr:hypothetical protein [Agrobacterium tumefaciens]OAE49636.1 hypothetical protein A7J57_15770 [Agrobacterium tumefaciens]
MPNSGNLRNRGISPQFVAASATAGEGALSEGASARDFQPRIPHHDRLDLVEEMVKQTPSAGPELAANTREIRNTVIDADIRLAKWGWIVLAIAHCGLIYFMVHNLG